MRQCYLEFCSVNWGKLHRIDLNKSTEHGYHGPHNTPQLGSMTIVQRGIFITRSENKTEYRVSRIFLFRKKYFISLKSDSFTNIHCNKPDDNYPNAFWDSHVVKEKNMQQKGINHFQNLTEKVYLYSSSSVDRFRLTRSWSAPKSDE